MKTKTSRPSKKKKPAARAKTKRATAKKPSPAKAKKPATRAGASAKGAKYQQSGAPWWKAFL